MSDSRLIVHEGKNGAIYWLAADRKQVNAAMQALFKEEHIWELNGVEDFHNLTLTPSVDASKVGHWHGFITNGEIR